MVCAAHVHRSPTTIVTCHLTEHDGFWHEGRADFTRAYRWPKTSPDCVAVGFPPPCGGQVISLEARSEVVGRVADQVFARRGWNTIRV